MANYKLSKAAKADLIRIHQYEIRKFGEAQADSYFDQFFELFELIAERPQAFEAVEFIKPGYRRCHCGVDSIFYRFEKDKVEIMAIVGRQDISLIL